MMMMNKVSDKCWSCSLKFKHQIGNHGITYDSGDGDWYNLLPAYITKSYAIIINDYSYKLEM